MAPLPVLVLALLATTAANPKHHGHNTPEPPVTVNEFDVITPEPPVTVNEHHGHNTPEPPVTVNEFDVITPEPPVTVNEHHGHNTPEPPVTVNEFDVITLEPPVTVNEVDLSPLPEPSVIMKQSGDDFFETNPEEVDGRKLFEGDMMLTEGQWQANSERKFQSRGPLFLWPDGSNGLPHVPYRFNSVPIATQRAILAGIDHWESNTCIQFSETNDQSQPHLIFIQSTGCWSYTGRIYLRNGQNISIGTGCTGLGIVAHEIGHAIGFSHEQSRSDRDGYVFINSENILDGKEVNFGKTPTINSVPYDYGSDMHYGIKTFTRNGLPTITTKDPKKSYLVGNRAKLTFRDILLANIMYKCIGKWKAACGLSSSSSPCKNDGYIGANCDCVCPPGTSGANCQIVTGDYYGIATDGCTETVTTEGILTSPDYPDISHTRKLQCTKVIEAPTDCFVPQLTFTDFRLHPTSTCSDGSCCYFDSLEIRTDYSQIEKAYCDRQISAGQVFRGTSRTLFIVYFARSNFQGWSADLTFVDVCTATTTTTSTITTTPTATTTTPTLTATTTTPTPTATTTTPTPTATTITPRTTTTTTGTGTLRCNVALYNGKYYWTSPNFNGKTPYPTAVTCGLSASSTHGMVVMKSITFSLESATLGSCNDYVKVTHLFNRSITYCGSGSWSFASPSFNFALEFISSDSSNTRSGFNISIQASVSQAVNCHQVIKLDVGEAYTFQTPDYNKRKYNPLYCEYRMIAPHGHRIQVNTFRSSLKASSGCTVDFVLMNGSKDKMYPQARSKIYCDKTVHSNVMNTTTNELYVAYQKTTTRTMGFSMTVRVI